MWRRQTGLELDDAVFYCLSIILPRDLRLRAHLPRRERSVTRCDDVPGAWRGVALLCAGARARPKYDATL